MADLVLAKRLFGEPETAEETSKAPAVKCEVTEDGEYFNLRIPKVMALEHLSPCAPKPDKKDATRMVPSPYVYTVLNAPQVSCEFTAKDEKGNVQKRRIISKPINWSLMFKIS